MLSSTKPNVWKRGAKNFRRNAELQVSIKVAFKLNLFPQTKSAKWWRTYSSFLLQEMSSLDNDERKAGTQSGSFSQPTLRALKRKNHRWGSRRWMNFVKKCISQAPDRSLKYEAPVPMRPVRNITSLSWRLIQRRGVVLRTRKQLTRKCCSMQRLWCKDTIAFRHHQATPWSHHAMLSLLLNTKQLHDET